MSPRLAPPARRDSRSPAAAGNPSHPGAAIADAPVATRRGRPPLIQDAMLAEMRRMIVSGELRPGDRLPVRTELQRRFAASSITVQRVFDRLASDGLTDPRGPHGTFVAARPPHLQRIALLFPFGPDGNGRWLGYYAALARAAAVLRAEGIDLATCHARSSRGLTPEFERLKEVCQHGMAHGLIFASPPDIWVGTPVHDAPLPRISLTATGLPGILELGLEGGGFMRRAVETVIARGCRRPAVITSMETLDGRNGGAEWSDAFARHGVHLRPQWMIGADLTWTASAMGLTRLLCAPWCGERPDAIIIADDNFEESALAGLTAEGVRPGRDLLVVAHANFPTGAPPSAPTLRIGYDTVALLREAVARIQVLRDGGMPEPYFQPATFDRAG